MTRKRALAQVVGVARELAANVRCHCNPCWTERGRHDPKGCTWEDIADLRAAVNVLISTDSERQETGGSNE